MTRILSSPAIWTEQSATAFVTRLSDRERELLASALKSHAEAEATSVLLGEIRSGLGEDLPAVAAVYFESWDYEGMFYLNESARIYYRDGRAPAAVDFSTTANYLMALLYGPVGADTGLLVVPATGEITRWDRNADRELCRWLDEHGLDACTDIAQPNPGTSAAAT